MGRRLPKDKPSILKHAAVLAAGSLLALFFIHFLIYLEGHKTAKKEGPSAENSLDQWILKNLSGEIPSPAVRISLDKQNALHLKIDLPLQKYLRLEARLEQDIKDFSAAVLAKEKQEKDTRVLFMWEVEKKGSRKVSLLFSCPKPIEPVRPPSIPAKSQVAIIIDDMGFNLEAVKIVCSLRLPVTLSILPFSPHAQQTAEHAHACGLETMLHLPLESYNHQETDDSEAGWIHSGMSKEEIQQEVKQSLAQLPLSQGVNNHTGSKLTEDAEIMSLILEVLKEKNLYFIDSRTSQKSVAYATAQKMGIPSAQRHIFLDTENSGAAVRKNLERLFQLARKKGRAVGICHPFEATLQALKKCPSLAEEYEVELVPASQIVERPEKQASSEERP
ncbi:MAG: divergent polysaccharide deacetylase family protein [Candidatus Aminicenantales bacterium]